MSLSRWKMMAGVLGVSLGGLAAIAGQCPKSDASKNAHRSSDPPPVEFPAPPMVAPAGSAPAVKAPEMPAPAPAAEPLKLPAVPMPETKPASAPTLPPVPGTGSAVPMPVIPASGTAVPPPPAPKVDVPKPPTSAVPSAPSGIELPKLGSPTPPPELGFTKPAVPTTPSTPSAPPAAAPSIGIDPPVRGAAPATSLVPPTVGVGTPQTGPSGPADPLVVPDAPPAKPPVATIPTNTPVAVQTKFRILLRVGEGEPTFEVKCGDNLVLKVVCEKVDIKSPEKGPGLSAVKASGKVRFVGFGAEGTCDELAFLAGTGEVSMSGAVKVQVKDKLGRVESELSTEAMKYKIDPCAVGGALKP